MGESTSTASVSSIDARYSARRDKRRSARCVHVLEKRPGGDPPPLPIRLVQYSNPGAFDFFNVLDTIFWLGRMLRLGYRFTENRLTKLASASMLCYDLVHVHKRVLGCRHPQVKFCECLRSNDLQERASSLGDVAVYERTLEFPSACAACAAASARPLEAYGYSSCGSPFWRSRQCFPTYACRHGCAA